MSQIEIDLRKQLDELKVKNLDLERRFQAMVAQAAKWRQRYDVMAGRQAVAEIAAKEAHKGARRLRAKYDVLRKYMNDHQQWPIFRAEEKAERDRKKAEWLAAHPEIK